MIDQSTYVEARQKIAAGAIVFTEAPDVITTAGVSVPAVRALMKSADARVAQYADELNDAITSRLKSADVYERYVGLPAEAQPAVLLRGGVVGMAKQLTVEYGGIKSVDGGLVISKNAELASRIDFVRGVAAEGGLHKYIVPRIATTGQIDRANDRVIPRGGKFENYLKNPVVLFNHKSEVVVGNTVGINRRTDSIVLEHQYHGLDGQDGVPRLVAMLAMSGVMAADSIGFIPLAYDDSEQVTQEMIDQRAAYPFTSTIRAYTSWELLEDSLVSVPMNPGAVSSGKSWEKHLDVCIERGMLTGDDAAKVLNAINSNTTIQVKNMNNTDTAKAAKSDAATATSNEGKTEVQVSPTAPNAKQIEVKYFTEEAAPDTAIGKAMLGESIHISMYISALETLTWRMMWVVVDALEAKRLDMLPAIFEEFAAIATTLAEALVDAPDDEAVIAMNAERIATIKTWTQRAGQVLSRKNRELLESARTSIEQVLEAASDMSGTEESADASKAADDEPVYISQKQYERDIRDILKTLHGIRNVVTHTAQRERLADAALKRVRQERDAAQLKEQMRESIIQRAIKNSLS